MKKGILRGFCIVVLALVFFTSSAFSHVCYSGRYSEDIRFFNINGNRIYTLFTDYFSGEVYNEVERIIMTSSDAEERLLNLSPLVLEYGDRVISGQSHLTQLGSLLNSINWIGIELPEEASYEEFIARHINTGINAYSFSKRKAELALEFSPDDDRIDHLLYIQFPFWLKLLTESPDILNNIRMIPLESADLYSEAMNLREVEPERIVDQLSPLKINSMSDQQRSFLWSRLPESRPDEDDLLDSQDIGGVLNDLDFEDPDVVEVVRTLVDWSNNWIRNVSQRHDFVVTSALNQDSNGIIITNRFHRESLGNKLMQACKSYY